MGGRCDEKRIKAIAEQHVETVPQSRARVEHAESSPIDGKKP